MRRKFSTLLISAAAVVGIAAYAGTTSTYWTSPGWYLWMSGKTPDGNPFRQPVGGRYMDETACKQSRDSWKASATTPSTGQPNSKNYLYSCAYHAQAWESDLRPGVGTASGTGI